MNATPKEIFLILQCCNLLTTVENVVTTKLIKYCFLLRIHPTVCISTVFMVVLKFEVTTSIRMNSNSLVTETPIYKHPLSALMTLRSGANRGFGILIRAQLYED